MQDWRRAKYPIAAYLSASPMEAVELASEWEANMAARGDEDSRAGVRGIILHELARIEGTTATLAATRVAAGAAGDYRRARVMQLVDRRPADHLLDLLRDDAELAADPEFGLLLTHELVTHGSHVEEVAEPYVAWARSTDHPLALLPTELSDIEQDIPRPPKPLPALAPLAMLISGFGRRLGDASARHTTAAFDSWVRYSNGSVEVASWEVGEGFGVAPGESPSLTDQLPARRLPPSAVCRVLFQSARDGGAYGRRGIGGGFGRLAMWESLAGFVGAPWPGKLDAIRQAVHSARWVAPKLPNSFHSIEWFRCIAWDVWLVCEVDGRVTVVAATDHD